MELDPVYQTHEQFYNMSSEDETEVMVLENVAKVDPRHFGMGTARPRHYGIAWDTRKVKWNSDVTLDSILTALFARPVMTALSYFTMKVSPTTLTTAEDTSAKC